MKKIFWILIWMVIAQNPAFSKEPAPKMQKPISTKTVRALSLLPINGPALIYAKKPVAGVIVTLVEAGGLAIGIGSAVLLTKKEECHSTPNSSPGNLCDQINFLALAGTIMGFGIWLPSYIYTAIDAPEAAQKYNKKLEQQKIQIVPTVSASGDGAFFGISGRF